MLLFNKLWRSIKMVLCFHKQHACHPAIDMHVDSHKGNMEVSRLDEHKGFSATPWVEKVT